MVLSDWLQEAKARLTAAGIESAALEAQLLAAHVLRCERTWIIAHPEVEINDLAAETILQRREQREPLSYILGSREFYGRKFFVRPGVLIPRQDTEALLESALAQIVDGPILDIGTGSGCLAVTIKLEKPEVDVVALDISDVALEIARDNATYHEAKVQFIKSDLFENLPPQQFEIIVSNPPYIADSEELMPDVANYEPHRALFSGPTGLEFYERIAAEATPYLAFLGRLMVEIGHTQAKAVEEIFVRHGWFHEWTTFDLSEIERVLCFSRPNL